MLCNKPEDSRSRRVLAEAASLYVHIPFCEHRCGYCSFVSFVAGDAQKDEYIRLLSVEMELLCCRVGSGKQRIPLSTLYIGGGTPSCLTDAQIDALFRALSRHFEWNDETEVTWEANPNTMRAPQARLLRSCGVNRISMGLQAGTDEVLRRIDRIHTVSDFFSAYDVLVEAGFDNISADLLTGLPGLTVEDLGRTVERLLTLPKLRHISCYALRLEADAPMARRGVDLPSDDEERDQFDALLTLLRRFGMERYEISNFAYPGWACRHNSVYWTGQDYLALGVAASSKRGAERLQNPVAMREYRASLLRGELPHRVVETLTEADERFEAVMLPLRTAKGLSIAAWERRFGASFDEAYPGVVERLESLGLASYGERGGGRTLRLTDRGFDLSNRVFALFMNDK